LSTRLQEMLEEFGCIVLNYTNNNLIEVDYFYSEPMYEKFLSGLNCRQGMGLFNSDEILEFNKIEDGKLIVVQDNGVETARFRFITIFKAVIDYKKENKEGKLEKKSLTFRIRKNIFSHDLNFFTENISEDFSNITAIKNYIKKEFGNHRLIDWNIFL